MVGQLLYDKTCGFEIDPTLPLTPILYLVNAQPRIQQRRSSTGIAKSAAIRV